MGQTGNGDDRCRGTRGTHSRGGHAAPGQYQDGAYHQVPGELGEFNITIEVKDMAQLESTFQYVATRGAPVEPIHAAVFSMVTDFKAALYRSFPDAVRVPAKR